MSKKGCLKRHRKQCKYGDFCRRYNIDQSCEFKHFHDNKEVDNLPADAEEFYDAIDQMEYGNVKNMTINDKQSKRVKEDLRKSEKTVSLLRLDVLELQKQNKEKMLLIEDLLFKVETMNKILEDNTCNSCKDTDHLKGELSHKSMYHDLLEKHSKSTKEKIQQNDEKEFKETIACKHCSFKFSDHQILKDHMKN